MKEIIIASRESKLALWQSVFVQDKLKEQYPNLEVKISTMKTKGDIILDSPLSKIGGKGLFTKELELAMFEKKAHLAVHSLKDVPINLPDGLVLSAITKRADVRDAFMSDKYKSLEELPKGAVVGTTSLRRRMQLLKLRSDLKIKNLRGNVITRISKLQNGEYDAIILASAGINRLELFNLVKYIKPIEVEQMIPAMGQAALGVESLDDDMLCSLLNFLNDENSIMETTIERDFVRLLDGGCQVPIGINAKANNGKINIRAIAGMPDASRFIEKITQCNYEEYKTKGVELANEFIQEGAKELLKEAEKMAESL